MASLSDGISNWGNPFDTNDMGWLSAVGYEGYVIGQALQLRRMNFRIKIRKVIK